MVDDLVNLLALRARLETLVVATTGTTTLGADADGFTRSAGSFVDDGFRVGMEVVPSGFTDNTPGIIESVSDLALGIRDGRTVEVAASGRSLTVGLPVGRAWENVNYVPTPGEWYVDEDYLPGPGSVETFGGTGGDMQVEPMYVLTLNGMSGDGAGALYRVATAILHLFPPRLALPVATGDVLRVRSDVAPTRGQLRLDPVNPARALVTVTIPLWMRTANTI